MFAKILSWLIGLGVVVGIIYTVSTNPQAPKPSPSAAAPTAPPPTTPAPTTEVEFTSNPSGATLRIAGRDIGQTPITITVPVGQPTSYLVTADEPFDEYNLYEPFQGTFTAPAEGTSISVWIDRTTAEEQQAARDSYAAEERSRLASLVRASPWTFTANSDAITDRNQDFISTRAVTFPSILERDARLYVRCDTTERTRSNGVVVIFEADTYLGDSPRADYRVDERPAQTGRRWSGSTTGTAAFVSAGDVTPIINEMRNGSELTVRLYDYRSRAYDYTFNVRGVEDALRYQGCYTGL